MVVAAPQAAHAQACCSGSSANEFGVVARGNTALAGLRVAQEVDRWSASPEGRVTSLGDSQVMNTTLTLGGGVRILSDRLQIQGTIPFRYQSRSFGDLKEAGAGVGDAELNLRWAVLQDDTEGIATSGSWVPFVEPYVGVRMATGRPPARGKTTTQADVTGAGDWQAAAGARVSRFITEQDVVFLSLGWGHAFPRAIERGGESLAFRRGEEFTAQLSYLRFQSLFWAFGGSFSYRLVTASSEESIALRGTGSRRLTVSAQISHFLSWPSWQITLGAGVDPPLDQVSANVPFSGVSGSLSFQRHFAGKNEYQ